MKNSKLFLLVLVLVAVLCASVVVSAADDWAATLVIAADSDPASIDPAYDKAYPVGCEIIINVVKALIFG